MGKMIIKMIDLKNPKAVACKINYEWLIMNYELKMIKSIERQIKIVKLLILIRYLYELQKSLAAEQRHLSRKLCMSKKYTIWKRIRIIKMPSY